MRRPAPLLAAAGLVLGVSLASADRSSADADPPDTTEPMEDEATDGGGAPAPGATVAAVPQPDVGAGSTDFERQLAELSFAAFLSRDLGLDAGEYACTEPSDLDDETPITCFTVIDGDRVIIATTAVSGGTGVYEFEVVTDSTIDDPNITADTAGTDANAAVLEHGEAINASADAFITQYLTDPRVAAITTYEFDPSTMVLTLDMALAANLDVGLDDVAWVNTKEFARFHWTEGQPFRTPGATFRPGFTIIVNGSVYVSDFALMAQVAEQRISMQDWLTIASRPSS